MRNYLLVFLLVISMANISAMEELENKLNRLIFNLIPPAQGNVDNAFVWGISHQESYALWLIDNGYVDVNKHGRKTLQQALEAQRYTLVKKLIDDKTFSFLIEDEAGSVKENLLSLLMRHGNLDLLRYFFKQRSNGIEILATCDDQGGTPWHAAATIEDGARAAKVITYLRTLAPISENYCAGATPLHWACELGTREATEELVASGANDMVRNNSQETDTFGMNLLHLANDNTRGWLLATRKHMLEECDDSGRTPLLTAAMREADQGVIEDLCSAGANVFAQDIVQMDALKYLIKFGSPQKNLAKIKFLLNSVADGESRKKLVNAESNSVTPLHIAGGYVYDKTEIAEELLAAGAEVDQQDLLGNTPLMVAALCCNEEMARLLVMHGADQRKQNNMGFTAERMLAIRGWHNLALVRVSTKKSAATHAYERYWQHKNTMTRRYIEQTEKKFMKLVEENDVGNIEPLLKEMAPEGRRRLFATQSYKDIPLLKYLQGLPMPANEKTLFNLTVQRIY